MFFGSACKWNARSQLCHWQPGRGRAPVKRIARIATRSLLIEDRYTQRKLCSSDRGRASVDCFNQISADRSEDYAVVVAIVKGCGRQVGVAKLCAQTQLC